eukprot:TRINITY_DN64420_c0_g1_i5.p1 TRINITY_DN64420_c0_g1~~TRINITY_DN64420_c0_g1_i5.p1  ORF type:complete len:198 (-),score=35.10 TRINITY_DN64420_c0_g1_i5:198-791(-)
MGVDLAKDLSWKTHVDRKIKKANSMLGFLKRNLKNASRTTKTNAYVALVRPHLEYCCSVWNPHPDDNKTMINKIEAVQRRAARYVTNQYQRTSSVTAMLSELEWESLASRRTKYQMTMFYKIVNEHVDINSKDYLTPGFASTRSNHPKKFMQIGAQKNSFRGSFFPHAIPIWNSLPKALAEAPSLVSFKGGLTKISF